MLRDTPTMSADVPSAAVFSTMVGHYFSILLRLFAARGVHTAITLLGLAVGLASCIMISLYVRHELSFEDFVLHVAWKHGHKLATVEDVEEAARLTRVTLQPCGVRL